MLKTDPAETVLDVIKQSEPHEWTRYSWSVSYDPDKAKIEYVHAPTLLVLSFDFEGKSLDFDPGKCKGVSYGSSNAPILIRISDSDLEYSIFKAFEDILEDADQLTPTQQEVLSSMTAWLKSKKSQ